MGLNLLNAAQLLQCGNVDCNPPAPPPAPPPVPRQSQSVDYYVKDYDSFLRALLDLIPTRVPGWQDKIEADLGMAILEVFAYFADKLSFFQDRVFNEGFLRTATQYDSVRRLLSLVDYTLDPGAAAQAVLAITVVAPKVLAAGFQVSTQATSTRPGIVFETAAGAILYPELNVINLASDAAGATVVLAAELDAFLPAGSWLFFQGGGSAEWAQTASAVSVDHVLHTSTVALVAPLAATYPAASSLVNGNGVLATHGQTQSDTATGTGAVDQTLVLSYAPLTYVQTSAAAPVSTLVVTVNGSEWQQVEDFIDSTATSTHYLTTQDNQGYLTIHFGDGAQGIAPPAGAPIVAAYRAGVGEAGLVAPRSLTVFTDPENAITALGNPLSSSGGRNAETPDDAKLLGPAEALTQDRAVTPGDYQNLLTGTPSLGILHAQATFEWTGSWCTVAVSIDFADRVTMAAAPQRRPPIATLLAQKKMAGLDVQAVDAIYAPLYIGLVVHVQSGFFARQVRDAVAAALGTSGFFAPSAFGFGDPVYLSDLYAAGHAVAGVQYLSVTQFKRLGNLYPDMAAQGAIAVGSLEIARCDSNPAHPENGLLYIKTCGGTQG